MFKFAVAALIASAAAAHTAHAADWRVTPLDADKVVFASLDWIAPDGLPDGFMARAEGDIVAAWYVAPTDRYAHGVLGDAVEAGGLRIATAGGAELTYDLPLSMVFEDRTPRIADLDGDGRNEVVTIRSSRSKGGGVAVYGLRDGRLTEVAAIDFIGRPNRWLNIASLADVDGDGRRDIAFVETPHIGGTLRVFRYREGAPVLMDELYGFSNHAIGATEMQLSASADIDGDGDMEVAIPDASRGGVRIMDYKGGLSEVATVTLPAGVEGPMVAEGAGADARFVVKLRDGSVVAITR